MNIFNQVIHFFSGKKTKNSLIKANDKVTSMAQRENIVYGKERLIQQKRYEKWVSEESWLLYQEGIPLLFGTEPGADNLLDESLLIEMESLWLHAQGCVKKELLSVINFDKPKKEWRVTPIALYRWATISRIAVPDELNLLMAFVLETIKSSESDTDSADQGDIKEPLHKRHREIVLGATISLLVNASNACKNSSGQITAELITRKIIQNKDQWFGDSDSQPLLTETAMSDLIEGYLESGRPIF